MKVQQKTIVVTGGGNGVGQQLVLALLEKEARVVAIDIDESALEETTELAGPRKEALFTYVTDLSDRKAVEERVESIISDLGKVDGLINNAGIIQPFVKLNELGYDAMERVMNVNFWGTLYLTKALLPHLLTRPEAHIVNISSMGGFLPVPGQTVYGASKAAVKLMTEGLHSELADSNVKVSIVFPGAIETNITANSGVRTKSVNNQNSQKKTPIKPMKPTEAASQIIEAMEKDQFRVTIGKDATLMDYLYRLAPKFAANFISKKMKDLLS